MSDKSLLHLSASTGILSAVPLVFGTGLAISLATHAPLVAPGDFAGLQMPAGLTRPALEESVTRLQWREFLQRAEVDDAEGELAPIVPPLRTRHATLHLVRRGRGLPIA